jgi:NAD(P)H-nitrite reductase large subunit
MTPDAKVCYCFHVTRRKLENFIRLYRPCVPSQLSECGGAGTGCGWCVPFLKQLFDRAVEGGVTELEMLTPQEYEQRREEYLRRKESAEGTPSAQPP